MGIYASVRELIPLHHLGWLTEVVGAKYLCCMFYLYYDSLISGIFVYSFLGNGFFAIQQDGLTTTIQNMID